MAATSNLEDNKKVYRSKLDIQYVKLLIHCVADYLALQFIASFHSVDVFCFLFIKSRERANEQKYLRSPFTRRSPGIIKCLKK